MMRAGAIVIGAAIVASAASPGAAQLTVGRVAGVHIETPHPYATARGGVVWSHTLRHPGATFLKLHFARLAVDGPAAGDPPRGDRIVLRDARGVVRQTLTGSEPAGRWSIAVEGEMITIELHAERGGSGYGLLIDRYGYGTEEPQAGAAADALQPRSICGANERRPLCAAVDPARVRLADPVARLLVVSDCGTLLLCTGFLMDEFGDLMTSAHCVNSDDEARSVEVWFNYVDDATAAGPCALATAPNPDVFEGGKLLAQDCPLDVAILRVDDRRRGNPSDVYGFLPLAARSVLAGEAVWVPQHPGGQRKEIAELDALVAQPAMGGLDLCQDPPLTCAVPAGATGLLTDFGHTADTQPGSSGAPVLSAAGEVLGVHHAGGCNGPQEVNAATRMDAVAPLVAAVPTLGVRALTGRASGALRLRAELVAPASGGVDPAVQDVEVVVAGSGGHLVEARIPAGSFAPRGSTWRFRDAQVGEAPGIAKMRFSSRDGRHFKVVARGTGLYPTSDSSVDVTITVAHRTFRAPAVPCAAGSSSITCRNN